jgi:hypothetical protein
MAQAVRLGQSRFYSTDVADAPVVPPPGVTGVIGWWDASVTASLNLTASAINSVADQSGGGNTMNWVNAKPIYSATGFNATKPAIVLGSSSALQATSFPMGIGNTLTVWLVGTMGSTLSQTSARIFNYLASGTLDYNSIGSWGIFRAAADSIAIIRNSISITAVGNTIHPAPHRIIFTISSSGATIAWVDGISKNTNNSGGNWISAGIAHIGRLDVTGSYWDGPLAECGIATGFSDAAAVGQLDLYLKNKWGL